MSNLILYSLFEHPCAEPLIQHLNAQRGQCQFQYFPDGESYLRIIDNVKDKTIIIVDSLERANHKILPLIFLASTLREKGALNIILVAPYLGYMRQDIEFQPGEAVTSRYFAKLISTYFDKLITVDPHLHRYHSLDEIYTIPSLVLSASELIASFISKHYSHFFLVGPDSESDQWVKRIAHTSQSQFIIGRKERFSSKKVQIVLPDLSLYQDYLPIIVDDIISSGGTYLEIVQQLTKRGFSDYISVAVHGIFSDNSYQKLISSGMKKIITCNTIKHSSNVIDVSELLAVALLKIL